MMRDPMTNGPTVSPARRQTLAERAMTAVKVAVVPPVGYHVIRLLSRTMTLRCEGMEHVDALPKGEPPRNPGKIVKASLKA